MPWVLIGWDYIIATTLVTLGIFAVSRSVDKWLSIQIPVKKIYILLFLVHAAAYPFLKNLTEEKIKENQDSLTRLLPPLSLQMQLGKHSQINSISKADNKIYLGLIDIQNRIQKSMPYINDFYTMKKNPDGHFYLMVDSETDYNQNGKIDSDREQRTAIGEIYEKQKTLLENAYAGNISFTVEPYSDKWGNWVSAFGPIYDENGRIDGIIGVDSIADVYITDITNHRITFLLNLIFADLLFLLVICILRVQQKSINAVNANRAKSQFLANMSHEIRTPLNGIVGVTSLLQKTNLDQTQMNYLDLMNKGSQLLTEIIGDILEFSKIESGRLSLEMVEFDIRREFEDLLTIVSVAPIRKGVDFTYRFESNLPQKVKGDPTHLKQVLLNLVGNAVKFTNKGYIEVTISCRKKSDQNLHLEFSVADSGIGIAKNKLESIFDPFTQADASDKRKYGGSGLGLTISREILRAHGGDLSVESVLNKGSRFTANANVEFVESPNIQTPQKPIDVLLFFDSPRLEVNLCEHLGQIGFSGFPHETWSNSRGHKRVIVIGGEETLKNKEKILAMHSENLIEEVFICCLPEEQPQLLIEFKSINLRFFSSQPTFSELNRIQMTIGRNVTETKQANRKLKVLLVDDNGINQAVGKAMVMSQGHDVSIASNGIEALDLAKKTEFDIILMDCQMPIMDGYEATKKIRRLRNSNSSTPIVAMTANVFEDVKEKCNAVGFSAFLAKPFKDTELANMISNLSTTPVSENQIRSTN